jgi:hypothetical protein
MVQFSGLPVSQAMEVKSFTTPELLDAGYAPEELHLGRTRTKRAFDPKWIRQMLRLRRPP